MMNATKQKLKAVGVAIGLIPTLAGAALTVIYDSGDTWMHSNPQRPHYPSVERSRVHSWVLRISNPCYRFARLV